MGQIMSRKIILNEKWSAVGRIVNVDVVTISGRKCNASTVYVILMLLTDPSTCPVTEVKGTIAPQSSPAHNPP